MAGPSVSVSRGIALPPAHLYRIIADYRQHHPNIVPKPEFEAVVVEAGGVGAGTRLRVEVRAGGRSRSIRMRVEEPEPGRVLREVDEERGDITTFTVEPSGAGARVTLETVLSAKRGLEGFLERSFGIRMLRRLYERELAQLEAYAATVPRA